MADKSDWMDVAYIAVKVFDDDDNLVLEELNQLIDFVLGDKEFDDHVATILKSVFVRIKESDVPADVWERMTETRKKYSIAII